MSCANSHYRLCILLSMLELQKVKTEYYASMAQKENCLLRDKDALNEDLLHYSYALFEFEKVRFY